MAETKKWAAYYRRWGCVCCGKKKQPSGGNGLCDRCLVQVTQGLKAIVRQIATPAA
jgi:NMD protein affecting ribosome stability and mRNA decay